MSESNEQTRCRAGEYKQYRVGIELNTRREVSYLWAAMYYFVYHTNTIGLYWEKKSTFPRWTITETDNGRNFISTKFSVIDFSLAKEEMFSFTRPKIGLWQISQLSIWSTLCHSFINLTQQIGDIKRVKIIVILYACCYDFSQGRKSFENTAVYIIIIFFKVSYNEI